MRLLVSGMASCSCATIAALVLFTVVTTGFVSLVALWRGLLGNPPWPGPEPSLLYLLLLLLLPLAGATMLGQAVHSRLYPSQRARSRVPAGALFGFAGWLATALVLYRWFWK